MPESATRRFNEPFVVVEENRMAFEAVRNLVGRKANKPASKVGLPSSRLLYLHGPSGVGKSHLIRSLLMAGEPSLSSDAQRGSVLLSGSQFAQDFSEALDTDCIAIFRDRIRSAEVLVCEDLQGMVRHKAAQIELEHAVDHILSHVGKVIVSATSLPRQIGGLDPRLVSRLHGGLPLSMSMPRQASRLRFLTHFAERQQVPVNDDVLAVLAKQVMSPTELIAAVKKLKAEASLTAVTESQMDSAKRLIADHSQAGQPTIAEISKAVARQFGVKLSDMRSSTRARDVLMPRQCAMWLTRQLTSLALSEVAEYFGRRNHSTVLHACTKIEAAFVADASLRKELNEATARINGASRLR